VVRVPAPFPLPPIPMRLPRWGGEEGVDVEEQEPEVDNSFIKKMRDQGFDENLIHMGLKVANNHSRTRSDALRIGENYIREMAK